MVERKLSEVGEIILAGTVVIAGTFGVSRFVQKTGFGDKECGSGGEFFLDQPGVYNIEVNGQPYKGTVKVTSSDDEGRVDMITSGEGGEGVTVYAPNNGWIRGYFPDLPKGSCVEMVPADTSVWEGKPIEPIIINSPKGK